MKENTILTLNGSYKYLVIYSTIYNNKNYIYITNINNPLDTSFFEYTGDDRLKRVKDIKLFTKLLKKYKEEKVDCLE